MTVEAIAKKAKEAKQEEKEKEAGIVAFSASTSVCTRGG